MPGPGDRHPGALPWPARDHNAADQLHEQTSNRRLRPVGARGKEVSKFTTVVIRDAKGPVRLGNLLLGGVIAAASVGNLVSKVERLGKRGDHWADKAAENETDRDAWKEYAKALEAERDQLRAEVEALRGQLTEARANDSTAMGYLAEVRTIVGGEDFPAMVRNVQELRLLAEVASADAIWADSDARELADQLESVTAERDALLADAHDQAVSGDHNLVPSLQAEIESLRKGAARYEAVRKLDPRQFTELWTAGLRGDRLFDDGVDDLIAAMAAKEANP